MSENPVDIRSPPEQGSPERPSVQINQTYNQSPNPDRSLGFYSNQPLNQTMSNFNPNLPGASSPPFISNAPSQAAPGNVDNRLEQQLLRYIRVITGLTILTIMWNIIYLEAFCLLRFACVPDGIETPLYVLKAMGVIFFLTMMLVLGTHYMVKHGEKTGTRMFKIANMIFIIALVVLFVVSFFLMGGYDDEDILEKWQILSSLDKLKYDDDIEKLVKVNKKNLLLHAIYNIGLTLFFVLLTIYLFYFDSILPERWTRLTKSRVSFAEDSLIVVPKNRQAPDLKTHKIRSEPKNRTQLDLPQINEERASMLGDKGQTFESSYPPHYQDEINKTRNLGESLERQPRQYGNEGLRNSSFGQSPERSPQKPLDMMNRGYEDEGIRPRNIDRSPAGDTGTGFKDIEMTNTNYRGSQSEFPKRRQFS